MDERFENKSQMLVLEKGQFLSKFVKGHIGEWEEADSTRRGQVRRQLKNAAKGKETRTKKHAGGR